jgi:hypothetical protein
MVKRLIGRVVLEQVKPFKADHALNLRLDAKKSFPSVAAFLKAFFQDLHRDMSTALNGIDGVVSLFDTSLGDIGGQDRDVYPPVIAVGRQRVGFFTTGRGGAPNLTAVMIDQVERSGLPEKKSMIGGYGIHESAPLGRIFDNSFIVMIGTYAELAQALADAGIEQFAFLLGQIDAAFIVYKGAVFFELFVGKSFGWVWFCILTMSPYFRSCSLLLICASP